MVHEGRRRGETLGCDDEAKHFAADYGVDPWSTLSETPHVGR